jgi:hypothetical protein
MLQKIYALAKFAWPSLQKNQIRRKNLRQAVRVSTQKTLKYPLRKYHPGVKSIQTALPSRDVTQEHRVLALAATKPGKTGQKLGNIKSPLVRW